MTLALFLEAFKCVDIAIIFSDVVMARHHLIRNDLLLLSLIIISINNFKIHNVALSNVLLDSSSVALCTFTVVQCLMCPDTHAS